MTLIKQDYLEHYGILRKSGRYPWGSGNTQAARNQSFLDIVGGLKKQGLTDAKIAEGFGMTSTQLKAARSIVLAQHRQDKINMAQRLKDKGYSNGAIAERMGLPNESTVRSLLAPGGKDRADILQTTADMLKRQVQAKTYIDVGTGVENHIGIARNKLDTAIAMLQEKEGYKIHYIKVPQLGTGKMTTQKVLTKAGVPYSDVYRNRDKVAQIAEFSQDRGRSTLGIHPPISVSSKRIAVRYAEQGGGEADGVIYVRPGVKDLSLGGNRYAQVRIAVDGTHFLKGMAMHKDDLPAGVDLMFNTNKSSTGNKHDAMKPLKDDPDNPFGSAINRQIVERDAHGKEHVTSAMNIVNEESNWDKWSKTLSSQMLSKQSPDLSKSQLDLDYEHRRDDLDEILKLTNPAIRKKLLESFSDGADSAAVSLKAAPMRGQATHVILPLNSIKPNEIYAPNYTNGTRVVLIRYPHAGTFEIPELTVNNNHEPAKKIIGPQARTAVGIHHSVARHLSGADFDGDTVLVIPNNRHSIKTTPPLEGLKDFDPQHAYPPYHGMRTIDGGTYNEHTHQVEFESGKRPITSNKQREMGKITNLIADMTLRGANNDELARAVRHSMVVIDSEKHALDYRASTRDNSIAALKTTYQKSATGGASTLITKAKSRTDVLDRKPRPAKEGGPIDPVTGKRMFVPTGATYVNKKGEVVPKTFVSRKLAETDNAHTLSSGTRIEGIYADHSNRLKALANEARKEFVATKTKPYSPSAAKVYAPEVVSLKHKVQIALRNRPLERQAQVIANSVVAEKRRANPNMDPETLKKIKYQALEEARNRTGAKKIPVELDGREWDAIQAGAVSNHMLSQIIGNMKLDELRALATPRTAVLMTPTKKSRAKLMFNAGYTQAEVAKALGVSLSTLKFSLNESAS